MTQRFAPSSPLDLGTKSTRVAAVESPLSSRKHRAGPRGVAVCVATAKSAHVRYRPALACINASATPSIFGQEFAGSSSYRHP
jgi:hypothetical protein